MVPEPPAPPEKTVAAVEVGVDDATGSGVAAEPQAIANGRSSKIRVNLDAIGWSIHVFLIIISIICAFPLHLCPLALYRVGPFATIQLPGVPGYRERRFRNEPMMIWCTS